MRSFLFHLIIRTGFPQGPRTMAAIFCAAALPLVPLPARAQTAPAAGTPVGKDLIKGSGGFERGSSRENYWDGVNTSGDICFVDRAKNILISGKEEQPRPFPPSIGLADMDGDGLKDIVATDPTGFFFFFKNRNRHHGDIFIKFLQIKIEILGQIWLPNRLVHLFILLRHPILICYLFFYLRAKSFMF